VRLAYYISGHGLGHCSRSIEVMRAIRAARPDAGMVVRSSAPQWIFDSAAPAGVAVHAGPVDTGVVQPDSLSLDDEATARDAAAFDLTFAQRVDEEARVLRRLQIEVVVADVPALALAAADRAGVPGIVVANFTWDWIFSIYETFDRLAPRAIQTLRDAYAKTSLALRLPLGGGFATMPRVRGIPLIARRSSRDRAVTRRQLGVERDGLLVLASFSGFGVNLPLEALRRSTDFVLLAPDRDPPPGLRYEDLVAAADVVVSKPGYGIVSECVANGTALLYTSRGRFLEYDVLVSEMPRMLRCRFISPADLLAGRWTAALHALLEQPRPEAVVPVNGAEVAAQLILEALH
jgi:L-arabinokinase